MRNFGVFLYIGMAAVAVQAMAQTDTLRLANNAVAVENLNVNAAGGNLVVEMDLRMDSLDLSANERFVFTPLVTGGGSVRKMPPVVVNGRRQQIAYERFAHKDFAEKAVVVRRRNGKEQSVHYSAVLPYEDWMKNSNVSVAEDLCGCGDVLDQQRTVLHRQRNYAMAYVRPQAEARKERHEEGRAFIDFPVDKTTLYPDYRDNPRELEKILGTIRVVKDDPNVTITGITIHGYASPEDTYKHNTYLADHRARTLKDYVRRLLALEDSLFQVAFTPEDWDGLREYVEGSNLEHRTEILALIDGDLEPDAKEWAIRARYPKEYRFMLDTWYPALRHSDYVVAYRVRPFSVEEAKALLYTKPQQLSLEEMFLVAQTYEPGSEAFNEVFEIAVRMYPDDPVANLNVACSLIERGEYGRAGTYLDKAGDRPEALHARGVMAARKGRTDEARQWLVKARDAGVEAATGNLRLMDME